MGESREGKRWKSREGRKGKGGKPITYWLEIGSPKYALGLGKGIEEQDGRRVRGLPG